MSYIRMRSFSFRILIRGNLTASLQRALVAPENGHEEGWGGSILLEWPITKAERNQPQGDTPLIPRAYFLVCCPYLVYCQIFQKCWLCLANPIAQKTGLKVGRALWGFTPFKVPPCPCHWSWKRGQRWASLCPAFEHSPWPGWWPASGIGGAPSPHPLGPCFWPGGAPAWSGWPGLGDAFPHHT